MANPVVQAQIDVLTGVYQALRIASLTAPAEIRPGMKISYTIIGQTIDKLREDYL